MAPEPTSLLDVTGTLVDRTRIQPQPTRYTSPVLPARGRTESGMTRAVCRDREACGNGPGLCRRQLWSVRIVPASRLNVQSGNPGGGGSTWKLPDGAWMA